MPPTATIAASTSNTFTVTRADDATRITISGQLLVNNRQQLKQMMLDELHAGVRDFTLDLGDCGYIDASGLGVMVSIAKKIREADGTLILDRVHEDLMTLLELSRLDTLFQVRRA